MWPRNPVGKLQKMLPQQAKPFFMQNTAPKMAKFHVCVHMFGKNAMLKLHPILLYNHLGAVYTCTAAKFGAQTAGLARAMSTRRTLPKRMCAGQSENELSPGFKTKNTRNLF